MSLLSCSFSRSRSESVRFLVPACGMRNGTMRWSFESQIRWSISRTASS
jgi:hypothetical protein